ncbi:MAG: hypothetical protein ABIA97_04425 [Candidatus Omnitrophota bacterium]
MFMCLGRRCAKAIKDNDFFKNWWFIIIVTFVISLLIFILITGIYMIVSSTKI